MVKSYISPDEIEKATQTVLKKDHPDNTLANNSKPPKKYSKNARSALIGYHQWNKKGEVYADEVLSRYEKARKKK